MRPHAGDGAPRVDASLRVHERLWLAALIAAASVLLRLDELIAKRHSR